MRIPGFDLNHRSTLLPFRFLGMNPLEYLTTLQGYYSSSSFDITDLFKNGEQGVWYDPSDLSTLFQDSAGTTPVTAAGQPVGLMLDKRLGLVRGSEIVEDTGFDDATKWISGTGVSVSGGVCTFATVASGVRVEQTQTELIAGRWYELTVVVDAVTEGGFAFRFEAQTGPTFAAPGTYKSIFLSAGGTQTVAVRAAGTTSGVISFLGARELPGNHAFQPTAASRPTLQYNATTKSFYLNTDGSDDWMSTNAINFTGTDKVSVFAGVRRLSDWAAIICELSINANLNHGSFYVVGGTDGGGAGYSTAGRGTAVLGAATTAKAFTYLAPDSAVLSIAHDIAGDLSTIRRNSLAGTPATGDKGTGNFGNYPLYLFRRGGTSLPFSGHFYGLCIVGRLTTPEETASVESLLANKTGVVLP